MKKNSTMSLLTPRDKYLRKKFFITEAEYEAQLKNQGGGCRICGKPPTGKALHVDHDHAIERKKILSRRVLGEGWCAYTKDPAIYQTGSLKSMAIGKVRRLLKRASVRGILCWKCNTSLKKFNDNPVLMRSSAEYIEDYNEKVTQGRNGFE